MSAYDELRALSESGRHRSVVEKLNRAWDFSNRLDVELLGAESKVVIGDIEGAKQTVAERSGLRNAADSHRGHIEFIRSRIALEEGDLDEQLNHLQRSVQLAERAKDFKRLCLAQIDLMVNLADRAGIESVESFFAEVRSNVTALGDPLVTASLHACVAEFEAKRGLFDRAKQRMAVASGIIEKAPNLLLQAHIANCLMGLALTQYDFDAAWAYGQTALAASNESGSLRFLRCYFGNTGFLNFVQGHFDQAVAEINRALNITRGGGDHLCNALESIAQVNLAEGRFSEALGLVRQVEDLEQRGNNTGRYVYRHSILTKAEVLARMNRFEESLSCLDEVLVLAKQSGDTVLATAGQLHRAEVLIQLGRRDEAWQAVTETVPALSAHPFDMYALYERVVACVLAAEGDSVAATAHYQRARRIYESVRNAPASIELARSWERANALAPCLATPTVVTETNAAAGVFENVAALLLHAGRPELLASGLVTVLRDTDSVVAARAVARTDGGEETLASCGAAPAASAAARTLSLGTSRGRTIELVIHPKPSLQSQATLNGVDILLSTIHDLERARAEREERLTLWPDDDFVTEDGSAIVSGKMRELMTYAKRVARANISVLITGESGTGKEVLARAIHNFSPRAKKPFVPFNCTAVPRELLESQMFGYRRGAFTGADRDNTGVIRSAKDGTLFLDEIGELGLDLQPKLLRFLESGEINPLGEPSPFTVDVRIVAATNANLDQLVEAGRFREDLYYRLNVIRLAIPPLRDRRDEIPALVHHFAARASAEFDKGQVRVAEETMEHLLLYPWPGNVRQLQNELRRMVMLADPDSVLTPVSLAKAIRQQTRQAVRIANGLEIAVPLNDKLTTTISKIEREMIKVALRTHDGRVEAAARALGISRKGLYLKRQRLGV